MRRAKPTKQITDALKGRNRTSLYDWIWDHWDELPQYRRYRVDWQRLKDALDELGLRGRDESKPLSVDIVRMTFLRVMRDKDDEVTLPRHQSSGPQPTPARQVTPPEPPVHRPTAHQPVPAQKSTERKADASRRTTSTGFEHDPHANEDAIRRRFLGEED
jgi:hypothetical protein